MVGPDATEAGGEAILIEPGLEAVSDGWRECKANGI
jgi:hypothetical protein